MKSYLNRKVRLAFGLAILTLLVMGAFSYRCLLASEKRGRWVQHSREVIGYLHDLALSMENIESSSREFVLTGDETVLDGYQAYVSRVTQDQATLRSQTEDNPLQQGRFSALAVLAAERIARANTIIDLRRTQSFAAAAEALGTGQ